MDAIVRLLAAVTAVFTIGGVTAMSAPTGAAESTLPTGTLAPIYPPQNVSYRVSQPTEPRRPTIPTTARCPEWWPTALEAGWGWNQLPKVDALMWRESRCLQTAHNTTLNADGSTDMGLLQINDKSWCLPTRWYPSGYLQSLGLVRYCADLFDPTTNLRAAKALYDYSAERTGRGFQPWGG